MFLLVVFYIAGFWNTIMTGYGMTLNPFKIVHCAILNGLSLSAFSMCFSFCFIIVAVSFVFWFRNAKGQDSLGRNILMSVGRQTYGDSHFEETKEFLDSAYVQTPKDAMGPILGQMDDSGQSILNQRVDNPRINGHMYVVGSSGSGKTFCFTKPYCLQAVKRRESIIITDPDGGLYRDMAGYFMDHGYVVRRLDLKNLHHSDGWDCLRCIEGADVEVLAQQFAHTIISNITDDLGSIYGTGPMSLLKAVTLRVALGREFTEKRNIASVYECLVNPAGEEFLDTLFDPAQLTEEELPCLGPYMAFKQSSPNLRGNIITNLAVQLQLLQNKLVCEVLSTNDIDLVQPGKQPCAFFCIFPDSHSTYQFIVSLFFSMLFIKLVDFADNQPEGRCPVPVNFLLDEFPSIGCIPDFDRKIATVRKRAINIIMIFQDLTQLQNNYEKTWVTLIGNCYTFLSLGINDSETADMVNKRIGETTVQTRTDQHNSEMEIFDAVFNHSTGEGRRSLLSYDEIFRVGADDCVVIFQRHNPIFCHKYPYNIHPEYKYLRKIQPGDLTDIEDKEARRKLREREKAYVEAYLKKHPLEEIDRSYADIRTPDPPKTIWELTKEAIASLLTKIVTPVGQAGPVPGEIKPEAEPETMEAFFERETPGYEECALDEEASIALPVQPSFEPVIDPETGELIEESPSSAQMETSHTEVPKGEQRGSSTPAPETAAPDGYDVQKHRCDLDQGFETPHAPPPTTRQKGGKRPPKGQASANAFSSAQKVRPRGLTADGKGGISKMPVKEGAVPAAVPPKKLDARREEGGTDQ